MTEPAEFAAMSDEALVDAYEEQRREMRRHEARSLALLAEIDRRGSFERFGYLSATAMVAHRVGDSHRGAAGRVRMARALTAMPQVAAAFEDGALESVRVRRLVDARETAPDSFAHAEGMLVGQASRLDARDFVVAVEMWRRAVAADEVRAEERGRFEARRVSITETFEGMIHLDADLDPVSGEVVITAIQSLAGPANRDDADGRQPAQRRADALTEICRAHLDAGIAPTAGGERPHLNVIVDLQTFTGETTRRCEIGERRVLGPAAVEFLACDSAVSRIVTDSPSRVLDMGRRVRTATPNQLRALAVRDGGCRIPGCNRPPSWCDAHHLIPWVEGGLTDVGEMCLICRPHHMMIHLGVLDPPSLE